MRKFLINRGWLHSKAFKKLNRGEVCMSYDGLTKQEFSILPLSQQRRIENTLLANLHSCRSYRSDSDYWRVTHMLLGDIMIPMTFDDQKITKLYDKTVDKIYDSKLFSALIGAEDIADRCLKKPDATVEEVINATEEGFLLIRKNITVENLKALSYSELGVKINIDDLFLNIVPMYLEGLCETWRTARICNIHIKDDLCKLISMFCTPRTFYNNTPGILYKLCYIDLENPEETLPNIYERLDARLALLNEIKYYYETSK